MEIMTKEDYFKGLLEKTILKLEEIQNALNKIKCGSDEDAAFQTNWDIGQWFDLEGAELDSVVNSEFDDAYDEYVERNQADHIYEATLKVTYNVTCKIHAKDEDEAEDYMLNEICTEDEGVYFSDDSKVIEDTCTDHYEDADWEIVDMTDCGEYEEDE